MTPNDYTHDNTETDSYYETQIARGIIQQPLLWLALAAFAALCDDCPFAYS